MENAVTATHSRHDMQGGNATGNCADSLRRAGEGDPVLAEGLLTLHPAAARETAARDELAENWKNRNRKIPTEMG